MNEKLKMVFGVLLTAGLLFSLGYVGVKAILKKKGKPPVIAAPPVVKTHVIPPLTPEEKRKELEKKIAKNPKDAHLHFLLAEEYRKSDEKILALLEYRKAIGLNPKSQDAASARNWLEGETVLAKKDWGENIGVRYQLSMQLESYTSLTGSLASITQAVAMKEQQFQASATAAAPTGLTATPQAAAPPASGSQLPSFLPAGTQILLVPPQNVQTMPAAPPGTTIPGSPATGPGTIVTRKQPPAGYANPQATPPVQQPATSQPPPGFTPLGSK